VPISWKGWALFVAYLGAILAIPAALQLLIGYEGSVPLRLFCVFAVSVPFMFIAWKKTEGGWHWRRGEESVDD
jgi:hypothetical protein